MWHTLKKKECSASPDIGNIPIIVMCVVLASQSSNLFRKKKSQPRRKLKIQKFNYTLVLFEWGCGLPCEWRAKTMMDSFFVAKNNSRISIHREQLTNMLIQKSWIHESINSEKQTTIFVDLTRVHMTIIAREWTGSGGIEPIFRQLDLAYSKRQSHEAWTTPASPKSSDEHNAQVWWQKITGLAQIISMRV